MIVDLILLENRNFCAYENNFQFLPESDNITIPLEVDQYTNCSGCPNFSEYLELQKYTKCSDPTSDGQVSVLQCHRWIGNADTHSTRGFITE